MFHCRAVAWRRPAWGLRPAPVGQPLRSSAPRRYRSGAPKARAWATGGAVARGRGQGSAEGLRPETDAAAAACCWPERPPTPQRLALLTELQRQGDVYARGGSPSGPAELADWLGTDPARGLASDPEDLAVREARYGANRVAQPAEVSLLALVAEALSDYTIVTLLLAGAASLALEFVVNKAGDANWIEGASIEAAVAVVVAVTAGSNYQKEAQFRALQEAQRDVQVRALRDGCEVGLSVYRIVPGDVLLVEAGDILVADGVLVQGCDLRVDESHLTGESDDVQKDPGSNQALYAGSKVVTGFGRQLVTAVGASSQAGAIAEMVARGGAAGRGKPAGQPSDGLREETVLQRKLAAYATTIGKLGLGAAVLATAAMAARFTAGVVSAGGEPWSWAYAPEYLRILTTGVTILVVAVPEGLPLAVTLALAFSVRRMLADNNLVRHLSAAETAGTATVICTDKTGTLTQNDQVVSSLWLAGAHLADIKPLSPPSDGSRTRDEAGAGPGGSSSGSVPRLRQALEAEVGPDLVDLLCQSISLNSTANLYLSGDGTLRASGNRTEVGMLRLARALGSDLEGARAGSRQVIAQAPFSSDRKRMSTAVATPRGDGRATVRVLTKGAAEVVLGLCCRQLGPGGDPEALPPEAAAALLAGFQRGGQRLLGLAYRDVVVPAAALPAVAALLRESFDADGDEALPQAEVAELDFLALEASDGEVAWGGAASLAESLERDLTLVALLGIVDPLRPEVPAAIAACQVAGIDVKMLTGDNKATAEAIARQCGILPPEGAAPPVLPGSSLRAGSDVAAPEPAPFAVMEGSDFRRRVLSPDGSIRGEAFLQIWPQLRVLARCTPADKFTIVRGVRSLTSGVVAVTGDGTNDAPALRAANVGFAMNSGTATAREAADIVLLDDNFASIVSAVLWGRNVYANAAKFLQFQLTVNVVAVTAAVGGAVLGSGSPLSAVQLLWVNLIMDSLASLALATEAPDPALLRLPPFGEEQFLDARTPAAKHVAGQAAYQLAVLAALLAWAPGVLGIPAAAGAAGPSEHGTLAFNAFVLMQLCNQVNCRQVLDAARATDGLAAATLFNAILAAELGLQVAIVQFGGRAFSTQPLSAAEWALCAGLGASTLLLREGLRRVPWPAAARR